MFLLQDPDVDLCNRYAEKADLSVFGGIRDNGTIGGFYRQKVPARLRGPTKREGIDVSQQIRDQIILLALAALVFFANLGEAPLWDRDEPRNAGCTAEMLQAGNWTVPVFNDELRTHKPILLYWLMMASYSLFGVSEFSARAVSACAGLGTVVLTYRMAKNLFPNGRDVACWSGVILLSTIMFAVASRAATPDALLMFCNTLAIYFFVRGSFTASKTDRTVGSAAEFMPRGFNLYAMYAAMGLGVLAKGPVGLVLPTAVIGMYLLIVGLPAMDVPRTLFDRVIQILRPFAPLHFLKTCWQMRPLTAILTATAVAFPWYAWVHVQTDGVWTSEFFWTHNVSRASATMEGHSGPPILFYVGAILIGFFPWSILSIPTVIHTTRSKKSPSTSRAIVFLLCWVCVYVGIFSVAKTKLPSYVTPCYPALAILVGHFISRWSLEGVPQSGWLKIGLGHWIAIGITLLIGLPIAANHFLPGSEWLGVIGLVPLLGGIVCWRLLSNQPRHIAMGLAVTAVAFVATLVAFVPAEIGRHRKDSQLFSEIGQHDGPVVAFGHLEPSWIFYGGKPIREFKHDEQAELDLFLAEHVNAMLITSDRIVKPLSEKSPLVKSFQIVHETEYFLRDRSLLLLKSEGSLGLAGRMGHKTR